jgi:hypothetical protein
MIPQEIDEEEVEYFGDFDDMFDDLDDSNSEEIDLSPNAIMLNNIVNKKYDKLSAEEFLSDYGDYQLDEMSEILEDIDDLLFTIYKQEHNDFCSEDLEMFISVFEIFKRIFTIFGELHDIYAIIETIEKQIEQSDIDNLDEKQTKKLHIFIKAIVDDLTEFKDQVFIHQTATNIYYLNASIASNSMQIDNILRKE